MKKLNFKSRKILLVVLCSIMVLCSLVYVYGKNDGSEIDVSLLENLTIDLGVEDVGFGEVPDEDLLVEYSTEIAEQIREQLKLSEDDEILIKDNKIIVNNRVVAEINN